jgi:hypothetical protein
MIPDGPTYADVRTILRLSEKAAAARARIVAAWRATHPEATCSDRVALALAEMEAAYVPRGSDA